MKHELGLQIGAFYSDADWLQDHELPSHWSFQPIYIHLKTPSDDRILKKKIKCNLLWNELNKILFNSELC